MYARQKQHTCSLRSTRHEGGTWCPHFGRRTWWQVWFYIRVAITGEFVVSKNGSPVSRTAKRVALGELQQRTHTHYRQRMDNCARRSHSPSVSEWLQTVRRRLSPRQPYQQHLQLTENIERNITVTFLLFQWIQYRCSQAPLPPAGTILHARPYALFCWELEWVNRARVEHAPPLPRESYNCIFRSLNPAGS